jgi:hypothetical protein
VDRALPENLALSSRADVKDLAVRVLPYGWVREVYLAPNPAAPLVIHIQDAHEVEEAQRNIADMILALSAHGQIPLVGLEGAFGSFDLQPYRREPSPAVRRQAAEFFMGLGYLGGAETAAIAGDRPPTLWGVEDRDAYLGNLRAIADSLAVQTQALEQLQARRREIETAKAKVYSPALKEFVRHADARRRNAEPLSRTVAYYLHGADREVYPQLERFQRIAERESSLDFKEVERQRRALAGELARRLSPADQESLVRESLFFKQGARSPASYGGLLKGMMKRCGLRPANFALLSEYLDYVEAAQTLNKDALWDELLRRERDLPLALAATPEQKDLVRADHRLGLEEKLVNLTLNPTEWEDYKAVSGEGVPDSAPFESYFSQALARNDPLADNLLARMGATGAPRAILVAGGFHTEGVTARLRRNDVSYLVVTPRITKPQDMPHPLAAFTRDPLPLEKLLAGETVNVAYPRLTSPGTVEGTSVPETTKRGQTLFQGFPRVLSAVRGLIAGGRTTPKRAEIIARMSSPGSPKATGGIHRRAGFLRDLWLWPGRFFSACFDALLALIRLVPRPETPIFLPPLMVGMIMHGGTKGRAEDSGGSNGGKADPLADILAKAERILLDGEDNYYKRTERLHSGIRRLVGGVWEFGHLWPGNTLSADKKDIALATALWYLVLNKPFSKDHDKRFKMDKVVNMWRGQAGDTVLSAVAVEILKGLIFATTSHVFKGVYRGEILMIYAIFRSGSLPGRTISPESIQMGFSELHAEDVNNISTFYEAIAATDPFWEGRPQADEITADYMVRTRKGNVSGPFRWEILTRFAYLSLGKWGNGTFLGLWWPELVKNTLLRQLGKEEAGQALITLLGKHNKNLVSQFLAGVESVVSGVVPEDSLLRMGKLVFAGLLRADNKRILRGPCLLLYGRTKNIPLLVKSENSATQPIVFVTVDPKSVFEGLSEDVLKSLTEARGRGRLVIWVLPQGMTPQTVTAQSFPAGLKDAVDLALMPKEGMGGGNPGPDQMTRELMSRGVLVVRGSFMTDQGAGPSASSVIWALEVERRASRRGSQPLILEFNVDPLCSAYTDPNLMDILRSLVLSPQVKLRFYTQKGFPWLTQALLIPLVGSMTHARIPVIEVETPEGRFDWEDGEFDFRNGAEGNGTCDFVFGAEGDRHTRRMDEGAFAVIPFDRREGHALGTHFVFPLRDGSEGILPFLGILSDYLKQKRNLSLRKGSSILNGGEAQHEDAPTRSTAMDGPALIAGLTRIETPEAFAKKDTLGELRRWWKKNQQTNESKIMENTITDLMAALNERIIHFAQDITLSLSSPNGMNHVKEKEMGLIRVFDQISDLLFAIGEGGRVKVILDALVSILGSPVGDGSGKKEGGRWPMLDGVFRAFAGFLAGVLIRAGAPSGSARWWAEKIGDGIVYGIGEGLAVMGLNILFGLWWDNGVLSLGLALLAWLAVHEISPPGGRKSSAFSSEKALIALSTLILFGFGVLPLSGAVVAPHLVVNLLVKPQAIKVFEDALQKLLQTAGGLVWAVFDMDSTLTKPNQPMSPAIARDFLRALLTGNYYMPLITGNSWEKAEKNFVTPLLAALAAFPSAEREQLKSLLRQRVLVAHTGGAVVRRYDPKTGRFNVLREETLPLFFFRLRRDRAGLENTLESDLRGICRELKISRGNLLFSRAKKGHFEWLVQARIVGVPPRKKTALLKRIRKYLRNNDWPLRVEPSGRTTLAIEPRGMNKASAFQRLRRILGVPDDVPVVVFEDDLRPESTSPRSLAKMADVVVCPGAQPPVVPLAGFKIVAPDGRKTGKGTRVLFLTNGDGWDMQDGVSPFLRAMARGDRVVESVAPSPGGRWPWMVKKVYSPVGKWLRGALLGAGMPRGERYKKAVIALSVGAAWMVLPAVLEGFPILVFARVLQGAGRFVMDVIAPGSYEAGYELLPDSWDVETVLTLDVSFWPFFVAAVWVWMLLSASEAIAHAFRGMRLALRYILGERRISPRTVGREFRRGGDVVQRVGVFAGDRWRIGVRMVFWSLAALTAGTVLEWAWGGRLAAMVAVLVLSRHSRSRRFPPGTTFVISDLAGWRNFMEDMQNMGLLDHRGRPTPEAKKHKLLVLGDIVGRPRECVKVYGFLRRCPFAEMYLGNHEIAALSGNLVRGDLGGGNVSAAEVLLRRWLLEDIASGRMKAAPVRDGEASFHVHAGIQHDFVGQSVGGSDLEEYIVSHGNPEDSRAQMDLVMAFLNEQTQRMAQNALGLRDEEGDPVPPPSGELKELLMSPLKGVLNRSPESATRLNPPDKFLFQVIGHIPSRKFGEGVRYYTERDKNENTTFYKNIINVDVGRDSAGLGWWNGANGFLAEMPNGDLVAWNFGRFTGLPYVERMADGEMVPVNLWARGRRVVRGVVMELTLFFQAWGRSLGGGWVEKCLGRIAEFQHVVQEKFDLNPQTTFPRQIVSVVPKEDRGNEVLVLARVADRPGVLSDMAGVLAAHGFFITKTELTTSSIKMKWHGQVRTVTEPFNVFTLDRRPSVEDCVALSRSMSRVFSGKKTVKDVFDGRRVPYTSQRLHGDPTQAYFGQDGYFAVDTMDRETPGFLHFFTRLLKEEGINIVHPSLPMKTAEGGRLNDTFNLVDGKGRPLTSARQAELAAMVREFLDRPELNDGAFTFRNGPWRKWALGTGPLPAEARDGDGQGAILSAVLLGGSAQPLPVSRFDLDWAQVRAFALSRKWDAARLRTRLEGWLGPRLNDGPPTKEEVETLFEVLAVRHAQEARTERMDLRQTLQIQDVGLLSAMVAVLAPDSFKDLLETGAAAYNRAMGLADSGGRIAADLTLGRRMIFHLSRSLLNGETDLRPEDRGMSAALKALAEKSRAGGKIPPVYLVIPKGVDPGPGAKPYPEGIKYKEIQASEIALEDGRISGEKLRNKVMTLENVKGDGMPLPMDIFITRRDEWTLKGLETGEKAGTEDLLHLWLTLPGNVLADVTRWPAETTATLNLLRIVGEQL